MLTNKPLKKAVLNVIRCMAGSLIAWAVLAACNPQKENVANRGMQNLTAHYNILYNARERINESERNIQAAYQDNYDRLIPVYREPDETLSQPEVKKLDEAIVKANVIINEKSQSRYVDDAYFLIAKANHLKSNFFNAAEFFTYVIRSYPKQNELKQEALAWKARSLISSNRLQEAEATLDTAFKYLDIKQNTAADVYATRAQLAIYARKDDDAISLLSKAREFNLPKSTELRWTYILAQLQQLTGKKEQAYNNYSRIVKSNAPFEMAFNALLSSISIKDEQNGLKINRADRLLALLKDDKNRDFADQIYYEIGNSYLEQNIIPRAIENYRKAIRNSTRNQNQKGLAYLQLADIYFNEGEYLRSKAYYDSTLTTLSTSYPEYEQIQKKGNNLELLASRLSAIAREDTLQMLARLPEAERKARIGSLTRMHAEQTIAPPNRQTGIPIANEQQAFGTPQSGTFYFNNTTALSQGFSDFKRRWGNRKLEDNWRRSLRSSSDIANANLNLPDAAPSGLNQDQQALSQTGSGSPLDLEKDIPLTAEQKMASDQRIITAYYDIGNYYREVLNDSAGAVKTYETLLKRFPDNNLKLPVYYNLYRLYAERNPQKSAQYRDILLNQYPDSPFARIIANPAYLQQADARELALHRIYNEAYENYLNKNYREVLKATSEAGASLPDNKLSAQLAYLHALALGHTQKLPVLDSAFRQIVRTYPDDKLITPLVQQHIAFIDANRAAMSTRTYALLDREPENLRFVEEPQERQLAENQVSQPVPQAANKDSVSAPALKPEALKAENTEFASFADSAEYFFVVNVSDPAVNLNSSRFGIGQFNRANFSGGKIKHQLKAINNQNQLIFVGAFFSKDAVYDYYRNINPLMKEIMKISADRYNTFIISKQNLDKLTDRETIERYLQFYQKSFLAGATQ